MKSPAKPVLRSVDDGEIKEDLTPLSPIVIHDFSVKEMKRLIVIGEHHDDPRVHIVLSRHNNYEALKSLIKYRDALSNFIVEIGNGAD